MVKLLAKYKPISTLFCLLALSLILLSVQTKVSKPTASLEKFILASIAPFQTMVSQAVGNLYHVWDQYIYLVNLESENIRMQEQIRILQMEKNEYLEIALAYERLKNILNLSEVTSLNNTVLSKVIGRDSTNWSSTVSIDKGSSQDIEQNFAVITHEGIVGYTISVSPWASKVLLASDPSCSIAAIVQRTRDQGVVQGQLTNYYKMKYLVQGADVIEGDVVVSSGLGGVFPKGLVIGKIARINKKSDGLFLDVDIEPSVNFSKLEEVFIVKNK
jgi:rod shape-determining protein MreC